MARTHVLRETQPPWRTSVGLVTECGKPVEGTRDQPTLAGAPVYPRAELDAFIRREGQRRATILLCSTCMDCCRRWRPWEVDPVLAMNRETVPGPGPAQDRPIRHELLALADLVARHPDEFSALLQGRREAIDLDQARRKRAQRHARGGR